MPGMVRHHSVPEIVTHRDAYDDWKRISLVGDYGAKISLSACAPLSGALGRGSGAPIGGMARAEVHPCIPHHPRAALGPFRHKRDLACISYDASNATKLLRLFLYSSGHSDKVNKCSIRSHLWPSNGLSNQAS